MRPEGTSPLLIGSRRDEALRQLRGQTSTSAKKRDFERVTQKYLARNGREPNGMDLLQACFYRRWDHPVIIFDHNRELKTDPHFHSTISHIDVLLDELSFMYPRLSGHPYRQNGQLKDFDAEYLVLG